MEKTIDLYRVCDNRVPHVNQIAQLNNNIPLFLCRNKIDWFPDHLVDEKQHFIIYCYKVKYRKIKKFFSHESENYFNCYDVVSLNSLTLMGNFPTEGIFHNEDDDIHVFSDIGLTYKNQGFDIVELINPINKHGNMELNEMFLLNCRDDVISITAVL